MALTTWTVEQCDQEIAALEAALDKMILLPTSGSTGKTSLNFAGKTKEIRERIEEWQDRRRAILNGGYAPRLRRTC